jgi:nitrite reductase (NADH) small subunit
VRVRLCGEDELRPGELRRVAAGRSAVVVARGRDGRYRALLDRCAHQGAPLSAGRLQPLVTSPAVREYATQPGREVVRCGWHGYEFDLDSGRCPAAPDTVRVRTYPVEVRDGEVWAEI